VIIQAVKLVLAAGADATYEDTFGWTPLHAITQTCSHQTAKEIQKILRENIQQRYPNYFETFDEKKKRDVSNRQFVDRSGPHNRIPIEKRNQVLNQDFTLNGIARFIKSRLDSNQGLKVIVMAGAGISVNCGIPDFRSPDSGIYANISPGQFSLEYLVEDPVGFYDVARNIFGGIFQKTVKPSDTHYFLKLLADKNLLLRVYTQNIDTLEKIAGVPENLIVEAHGSFASARCARCGKVCEDINAYWKSIYEHQVPVCSACSFVVRPDVVFFGEGLTDRYYQLHLADFQNADLLIVMGTSLMVYPFASLVSMVSLLTPRLLINKNKVGAFAKVDSPINYRDVAYDGDCDEGVRALVDALGWTEELNAIKNAAQ
jgi:NAD+-dependent protein deacetylase sirtuin 2